MIPLPPTNVCTYSSIVKNPPYKNWFGGPSILSTEHSRGGRVNFYYEISFDLTLIPGEHKILRLEFWVNNSTINSSVSLPLVDC